ncbi:Glycine--tRNA ligase 1, mitochondrial [Talaromyces marneffei ATCC 18224]
MQKLWNKPCLHWDKQSVKYFQRPYNKTLISLLRFPGWYLMEKSMFLGSLSSLKSGQSCKMSVNTLLMSSSHLLILGGFFIVFWSTFIGIVPGDVARGVLSLPLLVASTKVLIVPLSNLPTFVPIIRKISQNLRRLGISCRVDDSGASIGKRYARNDELGIPLGITIDFDTVKDDSITLRERDSTRQVRASIDEIIASIKSLVDNAETWDDVFKRLPEFLSQVGND